MQKNLKIATFIAAVFVILVFTGKYFTTTVKNIMSYQNYNQNSQAVEEETSSYEEEKSQTEQVNNVLSYESPQLEAFNYNVQPRDIDPKSVKRDTNRKLSYANYEDRVRMESPSNLDANGLYVTLMQAVGDNDIKRAKNMLARGARVNSPDGDTSYAPIFWAIANGNVEMIKLLLDKGAKVNTPDEKGTFPIHWVVENSANRPDVYQMKAIFDLILDAHPEEINRQDTLLQQTPIMLAVSLNDKKAFAYLLDRGANLKILSKSRRDIIDLALGNACHACISLIETKEKQNAVTPLPNFASTFTAPDPIWLPYSTVKKTTKKKKQTRDPNAIVIQGDSIVIPTYKEMPQILPLNKEQGPDIVITN